MEQVTYNIYYLGIGNQMAIMTNRSIWTNMLMLLG